MRTDDEGRITTALQNSTLYTISTGLSAIYFEPILGTGAELAGRSPVTIEARRRITSVDNPCRLLLNNDPYVYFSWMNETDVLLTVPISEKPLNQIWSSTGQAVPLEDFPPGSSGFSILESHFTASSGLKGVWNFLGQQIVVGPELEACSDRGVPGQCQPIDPETLRSPFDHTRRVIMKLTTQAVAAARSGRWKGNNGRFSVPFLARGARSLAQMEAAFRGSKKQPFSCEVVPMSCTLKQVPKKEMLKSFSAIFSGKVPKGLEHISRSSKGEIATFQRLLRTLPETYVTCD